MAKILVIDDDTDVLFMVTQALKIGGHTVVSSTDPEATTRLARENGVDAVVLDIMMPKVSGFDALRALREEPQTGGIPVLFLSAYAESSSRIRGLREGADDFLAKPFSVDELLLRVERIVAPRTGATLPEKGLPPNLEKSLNVRKVVGQVYLGRYQALEVVGEGAMGLVFRGWDPRLKRPVALKTLRLDRILDDEQRRRRAGQLLDEAITVARFSHPNIVAVYDVESSDELTFMAMEYVDGMSLADYIDTVGPLEPEDVFTLALGMARGLAAAHERGIVHHDVKPGNVLLGRDGSVKVTDFGVAHLVSTLVHPEGRVFGTAGYLPPEALLGRGYDERGDLFAFGAVLYESLSGLQAFGGRSINERVKFTIRRDPPPLHTVCDEVPPILDDLISRLMIKDAEARIKTAREVVEELEDLTGILPGANLEIGDVGREARKIGQPSAGLHSTWVDREPEGWAF